MCEICHGIGFYVLDLPKDDPRFGKAIPCACQKDRVNQARQRKLESLDGLYAAEREHRFETTDPHTQQVTARDVLRNAFAGVYVLQGPPGTGKSHFLHCVVNQARDAERVAIYSTVTDVLDYLRAAFNPRHEEFFEDRWNLLVDCDVLALDELDEFNVTEWAKERFLRLIDERWRKRDKLLTVVALNGEARSLLPKVASRLVQGHVLSMRNVDMRTIIPDPDPFVPPANGGGKRVPA